MFTGPSCVPDPFLFRYRNRSFLFPAPGQIHYPDPHRTRSFLCLSEDLPVVLELIDTRQKLEDFLDILDPVIPEGVVTLEKVHVRLYRHNKEKSVAR
ncbi:MAG: DUF190 domain-containing protein [Candidatus Electrothrix communis]|nr:DUF190 domain-containing protein [Desulfobulbus sp. US4]WLE97919.1 MAG: DUF190 domain-containing protein [Candidatus Electrothrix communis]